MPRETINGFELHYEVAGEESPLAFIHGGFGGIGSTIGPQEHPWVAQFAERYRVVTYDRRSAGQSHGRSAICTHHRQCRPLPESKSIAHLL